MKQRTTVERLSVYYYNLKKDEEKNPLKQKSRQIQRAHKLHTTGFFVPANTALKSATVSVMTGN